MKVQLPNASAVVVPSSVVPSKMLMVLLGSAVPASVGVASLVLPPEVSAPVTGATSSVTLATTGVAGAAVSTVRANAELAVLTLPAVSVAVAVRLWLPSVRAVVGVKVQLPEASAVVVPSSVVPSKTLTVLLASAVPVSVGVASLVLLPAVMAPVTGATSSVTVLMTGAASVVPVGATVTVAAGLTLPAGSVAVALTTVPLVNGVVGV
ncbi:hypothetical protein GO305_04983 [Ralstonia solanacearum]|nr:hypothetical protein [Ralstonia solanacearum]